MWQNLKHKLKELKCQKDRKRIISALPPKMKNKSIFVTQFTGQKEMSIDDRFVKADNLLIEFANAKLVITSRLHTALPCLAVGTPVLLINYKLDERFSGLHEFLYILSPQQLLSLIQSRKYEHDGKLMNLQNLTNKNNHLAVRQKLIENVRKKINQAVNI